MAKNSTELVYEEESTVKFLRAEALYKNCIENPNSEDCLNGLYNEAIGENLWARVRLIELQLRGAISNNELKFEKPKKQLKELAQDHFLFAKLKWAQYILADEKSNHKKCQKAVEKLVELTDEKIYCSDAYYYLGMFYMNIGEYVKARDHFNKAFKCGNEYAKNKLDDIDNHVNVQKLEGEESIDKLLGEIDII